MPGYPQASLVESVLAKRCLCTMGGSWVIPSMDCEPGKSKSLAKGNGEEISHKSSSNCHEGATQQLSPSLRVSIHTYCTFFLITNTSLVSLLSIFVGILYHKAKGPGSLSLTTGLVARIWCSHRHHLASISGWKPKSCSKLLQAQVTWGQCQIVLCSP